MLKELLDALKKLDKIDGSQSVIFKNLLVYLALRKKANNDRVDLIDAFDAPAPKVVAYRNEVTLPFNNTMGFCSGEVALFHYLAAIGKLDKFIARLLYAASWNAKAFEKSVDLADSELERFMNDVFILHHHSQIDRNVQKHDLPTTIEMFKEDDLPSIAPAELSVTFVFDLAEIISLISIVPPGKMIRFSNGLHTVGVFQIENVYFLLDPSQKHPLKAIKSTNIKELATHIFKGLAAFCHSKEYIALNMLVFDLVGNTPGNYSSFNREAFYTRLLQNPKYKKAVLKHPNILRVGLRYDIPMLDMLFNIGFAPTTLPKEMSEMRESLIEEDATKVQYLLEHAIGDINEKPRDGETNLAMCIRCNLHNMTFLLLKLGADVTRKSHNQTPIETALEWGNVQALIMLLAFGVQLTPSLEQKIDQVFPNQKLGILQDVDQVKAIINTHEEKVAAPAPVIFSSTVSATRALTRSDEDPAYTRVKAVLKITG